MAGITKKRYREIQDFAFEQVQIRPLPDEAITMLNELVIDHNLADHNKAFDYAWKNGLLEETSVNGQLLNEDEVVKAIVERFGVSKPTAVSHAVKAARRKRAPNKQVEANGWGGPRENSSGPPRKTVIDVIDRRCYVSHLNANTGTYIPALNWEEMEDSALLSVQAQGGSTTTPGRYICPIWLKRTAVAQTPVNED